MISEAAYAVEPGNLQPPGESLFDLKPRAIKSWLSHLPQANLDALADEILLALRQVNATAYDSKARAKFLQEISTTVGDLVDGLHRHYVGMELPLAPKKRRAVERVTELLYQMGQGYYLVYARTKTGGFFKAAADLRRRYSLHAALAYFAEYFVALAQIYHPLPNGLWSGINRLYQFAAAADLHQSQHPLPFADRQLSLEQLYMALLLFSLSMPRQLQNAEITLAWQLSMELAEQCSIGTVAGDAPINCLLPVRFEEDAPPGLQHIGESEGCRRSEGCVLLDFSAAQRLLQELVSGAEELSQLPRDTTEEMLHDLQLSLSKRLTSPPQRDKMRVPFSGRINTLVGIRAIQKMLHTQGMKWNLEHSDGFEEDESYESVVIQSWGEGTYVTVRKGKDETVLVDGDETRAQEYLHLCQVINFSDSGYCLHYEGEQSINAFIGELMAVREDMVKSWKIGAVRWVESGEYDQVQFGIHLFAEHVVPGQLEFVDKRGGEHRALCLITSPSKHHPGTLITDNTDLQVHDTGELEVGQQLKRHIEVGTVLYETHAFRQFELRFR